MAPRVPLGIEHLRKLRELSRALLEGGGIERVLAENIILSEIPSDEGALWSLRVSSGYLRAEHAFDDALGRPKRAPQSAKPKTKRKLHARIERWPNE